MTRRLLTALLASGCFVLGAFGMAWAYFSSQVSGNQLVGASTLGAPASVSAAAGSTSTSMNVSITTGSSNPSAMGYTVFAAGTTTPALCTAAAAPSHCSVTGLTPNTSYQFDVYSNLSNWTSSAKTTTVAVTTSKQNTATALSALSTTGNANTAFGVTATVTGNDSFGVPAGVVVFSLYSTSDCSGTASFSSSQVSLSGGSGTGSLTPSTPGTYYWGATYTPNGDNFDNGSSACATSSPVTVNSVGFSATDKGNSASCTSNLSSTNHTCAGPSIKTTNGSPELIFVNLTGSNEGASTAKSSIASITGPFSGTPTLVNSQEYPTAAGTDYVFAYKATGTGNSSSSAVSVTFDSGTTQGTVDVDVLELGAGNSVVKSSTGAGNDGSGKTFSVALTASASSDSEVVFVGTEGASSISGPSVTPAWTQVSAGTTTFGSFSNTTVQASSQTWSTGNANQKFGYIALEINP